MVYGFRGRQLYQMCFATLLETGLLENESICSPWANSFLSEQTFFPEKAWCAGEQTGSNRNCPPCKNGGKSTKFMFASAVSPIQYCVFWFVFNFFNLYHSLVTFNRRRFDSFLIFPQVTICMNCHSLYFMKKKKIKNALCWISRPAY